MNLNLDDKLLHAKKTLAAENWLVWEKKTFNIHRGVIDWHIAEPFDSVDEIVKRIRAGVKVEFRPGWLRGFGFGTILHIRQLPTDCARLCEFVDKRNRRDGVWQWMILCVDDEKKAIGIHTWMHGFLRPIFDSVLNQLRASAYECESIDTDKDRFIAMLERVQSYSPVRVMADKLFGQADRC